jgi:hypothetical protein
MVTPNEKAFRLDKVKTVAGGGLDVTFKVDEACGAEIYTEDYHLTSGKEIHPDLRKLLDALRPIMARVYHLSFFRSLMETEEFKATKKQKELAETAYKEVENCIEVSGISLSGSGDNVGVVISGKFKADTNQIMAINTHRIALAGEKYGFEEKLEELTGQIETEVYAFLFKGKKQQMELFDEYGEPAGYQSSDGEIEVGQDAGPGLFPTDEED